MEKPELIKSLARVPELENQIRRVLADNENKFSALAKAAEQRVQAVVPPEEIKKVSAAAEDAVRGTTCRFPDTSVISRDIAAKVGQDVKEQVSEAVKQAIGENPVRHIHEYTTLKDIYKYAPESLQRKIRWMIYIIVLLVMMLGFNAINYFSGDLYLGAKYVDTYYPSGLTTNGQTHKIISCLPCDTDQKQIRQQIRKMRLLRRTEKTER